MGSSSRQIAIVRDVAVATALLAAVYLLAPRIQSPVLTFPYYFLVAGFDVLEALVGPAAAYRPLLVGVYLVVLASIGTAVVRGGRTVARSSDRADIALGLAAPLAVLGALALLVAASALFGTDQREPVWTAGTAGLALLLLAWLVVSIGDRVVSWGSARRQGGNEPES